MDKTDPNPIIIGFFFFLRCLVPLILMLGLSYLLRRLGFIPKAQVEEENNKQDNPAIEGDPAHGK
jgi:hypothetical protein